MASVGNIGGGGLGTTVVLGTKITQKLAQTGIGLARVAVTAATGLASVAAGLVLRGRGRRVNAGVPLE